MAKLKSATAVQGFGKKYQYAPSTVSCRFTKLDQLAFRVDRIERAARVVPKDIRLAAVKDALSHCESNEEKQAMVRAARLSMPAFLEGLDLDSLI